MTDRERITNLEEMTADIYLILDKVEHELKQIRQLDIRLAHDIQSVARRVSKMKRQQQVYEMQHARLHRSLLNVFAITKRNAVDIESYARNTLGKDDLTLLYEYMMKKFDLAKDHSDRVQAAIAKVKGRTRKLKNDMDAIQKRLDNQ